MVTCFRRINANMPQIDHIIDRTNRYMPIGSVTSKFPLNAHYTTLKYDASRAPLCHYLLLYSQIDAGVCKFWETKK